MTVVTAKNPLPLPPRIHGLNFQTRFDLFGFIDISIHDQYTHGLVLILGYWFLTLDLCCYKIGFYIIIECAHFGFTHLANKEKKKSKKSKASKKKKVSSSSSSSKKKKGKKDKLKKDKKDKEETPAAKAKREQKELEAKAKEEKKKRIAVAQKALTSKMHKLRAVSWHSKSPKL